MSDQRLPPNLILIQAQSDTLWTEHDLTSLESAEDFARVASLRDGPGRTLLYIAAQHGDLRALRGLLDGGGDVNATDLPGETALIAAARFGHLECVQRLLAAGADVRLPNLNRWTALAAAVIRRHEPIVELLVTHEQDLDPETAGPGITPVRMAVQIDHAPILRRLPAAGAKAHHRGGHDGLTPLGLARSLGRVECEQALLELGVTE